MRKYYKIRMILVWVLLCTIILSFAPKQQVVAIQAEGTTTAEIISLREENVKHFDMGNQIYQAIVYSHPVHEKDLNGNWQDINFNTTYVQARNNNEYQNNLLGVSFPATYSSNQPIMSIVNGNISIAMTLVEQNSPKNLTRSKEYIAAKVKNPDNNFLTAESAKAATFFSTLSFENVQENIDLEYVLTYDSVKENIVVNAPAHEYNYRFNLVLEGLYPQICNDGSITLYKVGSDISEYIIPSPFMYDAEGNMSESVSYTITKKDESKWELAISADASWVNAEGRAFPVVIDPTIYEVSDELRDTYVSGDHPTTNNSGNTRLWIRNNRIPMFRFKTPLFNEDDLISAKFLLKYYYYDNITEGNVKITAHEFTAYDWDVYSITWDSIKNLDNYGFSKKILDTKVAYASKNATVNHPVNIKFDITDAVENWISSKTENYGIGLLYHKDSENKSVLLCSKESEYDPVIEYTYKQPKKVFYIQNYYDSTMQDNLDYIENAIQVADKTFYKNYSIRIVSEGDPQYYNIIDECPYPNSPYCGNDCVPHHKNISYITNQLEADIDSQSERAVYWTNHLEGGFCSHNNSQGECIQLDENVYGAVLKGGHYVVQMMKMSTDDRTYELEICMTLVFIHELAHTFGIEEEYLSSEHDKTNDIQCVMEKYEENIFDANKDFYEAAKDSGKNLFCSGCTNKLNILFTS